MMRKIAYSIPERKCKNVSRYNPMNADTVPGADPTTDNTTVMDAGTWHFHSLINNLVIGTAQGERISNQIYLRYIMFQISFVMDGDHLQNGHTSRYCVIMDKDPQAGLPATSDVFANGPFGSVDVTSMKAYDKGSRYSFLLDETQRVVQTVGGATNPERSYTGVGVITRYIPVFKKVVYSGSTANQTSVNLVNFNIFMANCSSNGSCCVTKVAWRLVYNDM